MGPETGRQGPLLEGEGGEPYSQWEGQGRNGKSAGRSPGQDEAPLGVERAKSGGC